MKLAEFADVPGDPVVLVDRRDVTVVRVGERVVKVHAAGTDRAELELRLALAGSTDVFVTPIPFGDGYTALHDERVVTRWPYGSPVDPDAPDDAPWVTAAHLLARLHAAPAAKPAMRGPARLAQALERLRSCPETPSATTVFAACAELPAWALGTAPAPPDQPVGLAHGDWHLGQLVHVANVWRLIDADDCGAGPIAWDLARPAAWFASGMLDEATFGSFLREYNRAGGCAVPQDDPWPVLDVPARALTVQAAAIGLVNAFRDRRDPDEVDELLIESCRRMVAVSKLR